MRHVVCEPSPCDARLCCGQAAASHSTGPNLTDTTTAPAEPTDDATPGAASKRAQANRKAAARGRTVETGAVTAPERQSDRAQAASAARPRSRRGEPVTDAPKAPARK